MIPQILGNIKKLLNSHDTRSAAVKKNIAASLLIKGVSIIVQLLLVPLTLGYVNSEMYGIWLTLSSIVLWLNFFDVGFTLGLKNRLAEAIALNEWDKGRELVSTTYVMMIFIFVPLLVLLELIIPLIDWASFLNVSRTYNIEISKALYILFGCFCLQMIVNVFVSVVAAFQKVALSSAFPVIGNILSLLIIYILTKTCSPSLYLLAIAISLMPVLVILIASVTLYHGIFRKIKPSISSFRREHVKDLFGLGVKFFLIQIQVVVLFQATNILISNVSGPNDVTAYNIAYKYLSIAMMVYNIMLTPLWPAFTDAYAKGEFGWMKRIYKRMSKVYLYSALAMLIMVIVSPFVYELWVGDSAHVSYMMSVLVGIYMMVTTWDGLQVNLINGIGAIKLQTYVTLLGLLVHIPLSLFLGSLIGAYGVVVSMITINILYSTCFTMQIRKLISNTAFGVWKK